MISVPKQQKWSLDSWSCISVGWADKNSTPQSDMPPKSDRIELVLEHIRQNLWNPLTIEELAAVANLARIRADRWPRYVNSPSGSHQLQPFQARVPASADDDVVVHGDAEVAGNFGDLLGHLDVGVRRRRVAGGVVVQQTTLQAIAMISHAFCIDETLQGT
jgi:hypothetical protein